LATNRPLLRIVLSWLAAMSGLLIGLLAIASFGSDWTPVADRSPGWFLRWFTVAGTGLLGIGFLAGAVVAPWNRKRAGMILLILMPIASFCLAYPDAGFLVWPGDGNGYFQTPLPSTAIWLTALFYAPFLTPLLAARSRKLAVCLFVISAALAGAVFGTSGWTKVLVPRLAAWSALFLLFGLFWLGTHRFRWPPLVEPRPRSMGKRVLLALVTSLLVGVLCVAATLGITIWRSSSSGPDCNGRRLFARPLFPDHAVFTARILRSGHQRKIAERWVGDWAVGVIGERFWGVPPWAPRLVLLTSGIFWKGETYLVDGRRAWGLLTRFLPVVYVGVCTRTRPVADAPVDLRVLRHPPSLSSAHLIGYVERPKPFVDELTPPTRPTPLAFARLTLSGPDGTRSITTDESGVYQVDGLPAGDYTLQLHLPDNQVVGFFRSEKSTVKLHLNRGDLAQYDCALFWNGRIQGHVKDDSGKPARLWVMLLNADRSRAPISTQGLLWTNADGFYQFEKIPPGRFIVMVNPSGPSSGWPYDMKYYPSALRAEDAQVLQVGAGQEISGIDFMAPHLAERAAQVKVTWPNGNPVADAPICVAYEHTEEYGSLQGIVLSGTTDLSGVAVIQLYGASRVRMFAEKVVQNKKRGWGDTYYTRALESEVDKMADKVTLVLTSRRE